MSDKKFTSVLQKYREAISIIISVLATLIFFIILYYAFTIGHDDEKAINAADIVFSWQAFLITAGSFLLLLLILFFRISWAELYRLLKLIRQKNWNKLHFWIKLSVLLLSLFFIVCSIYLSPIEARFAIIHRLSSPDELLNARNIFIGLFGTISLLAVIWRSYVADKQSKIDDRKARVEENRRLDERFAQAVNMLSKELNLVNYPSHIGAIAELKNLAADSQQHSQSCINIICSCNQWMENYLDEFMPPRYKGNAQYDRYVEENLFSNRKLMPENRIAHDAKTSKDSAVSLLEERRSQEALKAISYILIKLGEDKKEKHRIKELRFANKMLCGIDLSYAQINHIDFSHAYLVTSNLRKAQMNNSNLISADLTGAYLRKACMDQSYLSGATLSYADLSRANLRASVLDHAKMQEANLRMANLENSSIRDADLTCADLIGTSLSGSDLTESIIACANLNDAKLKLTNLENTSLILSDLTAADLSGAIIVNADLRGAVLKKIKLDYSLMIGCDLNNVRIDIDNPFYKKILFDDILLHCNIKKVENIIEEWLQNKSFRHDRDKLLSLLEKLRTPSEPKGIENFAKESLLEKWDTTWYFKQGAEAIIRGHHNRILSELENRAPFNLSTQNETFKGSLPNIKDRLEKLYKEFTRDNSTA